MGIKVRHGKVADIAKLGELAGESAAARQEESYAQAMAQQVYRMKHDREMTRFNAELDLRAAKRAKEWEFEKAEISSQMDFAREERDRTRKLDAVDNALRQLDREVEAGRIDEDSEQYKNLRFSFELKKLGVDTPISLIKPPTEFGIAPWYLSPEYKDTPAAKAALARATAVTGAKVPSLRSQVSEIEAAYEAEAYDPQDLIDIGLDPADFPGIGGEEFILAGGVAPRGVAPGIPAGEPTRAGVRTGQVNVISPAGQRGTIPVDDLEEALALGYTLVPEPTQPLTERTPTFRGYPAAM